MRLFWHGAACGALLTIGLALMLAGLCMLGVL